VCEINIDEGMRTLYKYLQNVHGKRKFATNNNNNLAVRLLILGLKRLPISNTH
jgi:hypothetical protein